MKPYCIVSSQHQTNAARAAKPQATAPRTFTLNDIKQLYNLPAQIANTNPTIIVLSFGGGLFGTLNPTTHVLTNGDVQRCWTRLGQTTMPTVKVMTVGDAKNDPQSDDGSTIENTIDVETVGAICPNSTIILLIAPNTTQGFAQLFQTALNLNPFAVSCSWGLPEKGLDTPSLNQLNVALQQFSSRGINICCAAGDNGSSDGVAGTNVDFPGSSPNVVCCGGTRLVSPTNTYNAQTSETVWNNGGLGSSATGGGKSAVFAKPSFQNQLAGTMRCVPDLAANADPQTGVLYFVDNTEMAVGGTSIVAPLLAGYLAAIACNTFLNNILYQLALTCFHDVTSGSNGAYRAGKGYDMCTGLGSFDGTLLRNAINAKNTRYSIVPSSLSFQNSSTPQQLALQPSSTSSSSWATSDAKIATVNNSGLVTPISDGTCTVSNSLVSQTVNVVVRGVATLSTAVSVIPAVEVGQSVTLAVSLTPSSATDKTVSFVSDHPNIATVDMVSGVVTGRAAGIARITATTNDAAHNRTDIYVEVFSTSSNTKKRK